jgi:hypothetical protein
MHSSSYLLDSPREDVGLSDDMLCHHVHWVRIDPRCSYFRCEHNGQCRYWFATKGELNITLQVGLVVLYVLFASIDRIGACVGARVWLLASPPRSVGRCITSSSRRG